MSLKTSAPTPQAVLRTRWVSDPDFRTTYSYLKSGGTPTDRERLTTVHRGLQLAGEATWSDGPGTMHGAWFSGERAADTVLSGDDETANDSAPIIIVGAGLSGLAAGRRLLAGGRDSILLEAGTQPLGRARGLSTPYGDLPLGAMWLHGTDGHPLLPFIEEAKIPLLRGTWDVAPEAGHASGNNAFDANGPLEKSTYGNAIAEHARMEKVLDDTLVDAPLGQHLRRLLSACAPEARALHESWFRAHYECVVAGDLDDLSTIYRHENFALPGGDALLGAPLSNAAHLLVDGLDVRYEHRVNSITFEEGSWHVRAAGQCFVADSVIVTTSLPVVQRLDVWQTLPQTVREAAGRIGNGRQGKIFAFYEHAFWAPHKLFVITGAENRVSSLFVDVSDMLERPALVGFVAHKDVARLEAMSETDLVTELARILSPVHGH